MGLLFLGIFDVLIGLYLFVFFGAQALIFSVLLGLLYILSGWKFISLKERWRKIFLFAVIPLSILASFHFFVVFRETVSLREVLLVIGFTIVLPLVLNLAILTRPKVKEQFK